jgi:recombination protein RecT
MNAVTKIEQTQARQPTKLEAFLGQVIPPNDRDNLARALPAHVPFDRFERNLSNAIMNNPALMNCNPREVFREVAKVAALGLLFDAHLGEAYLITSRGRDGNTVPQARIGYRGLIKLARQSGDVAAIYAHEVCQNDHIECVLGDDKKLVHKPDLFGDRGPVVGYYAVVKFKDGESDFEPMNRGQIDAIRDATDGYKAFKAGKIKSTPWSTSYDEMAKKTVIRRLSKRISLSPDRFSDAIGIEDKAEHIEGEAREVLPAASLAARLAHQPASVTETVDAALADEAPAHDPDTGEIIEQGGADDATAEQDRGHSLPAATAADANVSPPDDASAATNSRSPERQAVFDKLARKAARGTAELRLGSRALTDAEDGLLTEDDHDLLGAIAEAADVKDDLPGGK